MIRAMKQIIAMLAVASFAGTAAAQEAANPLASFSHAWEDDPVWYDGKAEVATYDATRTIYGKLRQYTAKIYTNKEVADAEPTFTKSADNEGREVFKHHIAEDIPTEMYDYHFSTMVYVGTDDFKSLKLDMGSIEDCGATFKQYVNHKGTLRWTQASYFPDEGLKTGEYEPPTAFAYEDALGVVLRGYPFHSPTAPFDWMVLSDQTSNKLSSSDPHPMQVSYVGRETLALPAGQVEAHHLRVATTSGAVLFLSNYWFAADPKLQHVLVQYEGPNGQTYKLRSVERDAYWER